MTTRFTNQTPLTKALQPATALLVATLTALCITNATSAGTVSGLSIADLSVHNPTFVDDPNTGIKLETQSVASITSSNLSAVMPTFQARFAGIVTAEDRKSVV